MAYISQGGFSANLPDSLEKTQTVLAGNRHGAWPQSILGEVRTVTNLRIADASLNLLSFIASLRQTGVLLFAQPPRCRGVDRGKLFGCYRQRCTSLWGYKGSRSEPRRRVGRRHHLMALANNRAADQSAGRDARYRQETVCNTADAH